MSDFSGVQSSVLLPSAGISLFVRDEGIREAALALRDDWRFARVTINVVDGDVESAIAYYSSHPSPDLVMVETLEITDGFAGRLEVLGGSCAESTAAVVVGPVNDVYLYRKLIEMGVSDYLVKPLSKEVLAGVFAKILIERLGAENSKLIACIGSKGGVGTSALSHILADVSGNILHQKTIILDAAGGWSYLSVAMGGESVTTLHEVARAANSTDKDSFGRMIIPVSEKLSFLGTGAEALMDNSVTPENFEGIVNRLMQSYPVVIIDLSGAPIDISRHILARANDVIIISTPTLSSLRSARGLLNEAKTIRGDKEDGLHVVINKKGIGSGYEVSESDMATALKIKPELSLSFLPKLFCAAEGQGKLLSTISGGTEVMNAVKNLMENKLGLNSDRSGAAAALGSKPGFLDGFLSKVKKNN
jgi:pilus assembly protein CpaE